MVRYMHEGDVGPVVEMVRALAAHHGDVASLDADALRRDALGAVPWLWVLVAERRGALVGFAALVATAQLQFGARGIDIHHLFVDEEARGQGVGRDLVEAALTAARDLGAGYVTVGTAPRNGFAAAVYERLGFSMLPEAGPKYRMRL